MKTFISNPKLSDNKFNNGLISLKEGEFYFSFTTASISDFDLLFSFQENNKSKSVPLGFSISNTNIGVYKNEKNNTYLTNVDKDENIIFFEDTIRISESSPMSDIPGVNAYLRSGSPSLANITGAADRLLISENDILVEYVLPNENERIYSVTNISNSNKYKLSRKMDNKTIMFKNISTNEIKHYYNKNNIFDSSKSYDWKIIISQGGNELSIFTKNIGDNAYIKRETILYTQNIENCFINLSVSDKMNLSNCSFRFFKANIS